jgi:molybdopterin/thiamine biosynthesis adenylyltransferase
MQMEDRHIVIAGAGGNNGSHLLPHLARLSGVARLTLVDPDIYEPANLAVQNIDSKDIGQPKVLAQASKLRLINPSLEVIALQERIEDVPRGLLRCDLMVSCLDSRAARQHINEIAWRLNTPFIDCGILGSQNLARVSAYVPSYGTPCLECNWSSAEYSALETEYICGASSGTAYPSMASSALGALASSLVALEIAKLMRENPPYPMTTREILVDAENHSVHTTGSRRNPWCRFDHCDWVIEPWRCRLGQTTVGMALSTIGSIQVEGHRFAYELTCSGCGRAERSLRLNRPLARCPVCNRRMVTSGLGLLERLGPELARQYRDLTLAQIGLRTGDIVSSARRHYQIEETS